MRLLLAIFLPFAVFFTIGRPVAGIICLLAQITLIGWLPAAIWAIYALNNYSSDKKVDAMKREILDKLDRDNAQGQNEQR